MSGMGFRLARSKGMEGSTGNLHEYPIATGYSTEIFRGDLVTLNAGNVQVSDGSAGSKILGVFWGCKYEDTDGSIKFARMWDGNAGRSNIKASVILPFGANLLVKGKEGQNYTQADIGVLKPADASVAGDSATGQSRQTLGNAGASVATAPLVVMGEVTDFPEPGRWFEVSISAAAQLGHAGN